jgi:hypothetical protein
LLTFLGSADTADLWALINKRLTQYGASGEAEVMLAGGASIRQQAPNGKYMIEGEWMQQ